MVRLIVCLALLLAGPTAGAQAQQALDQTTSLAGLCKVWGLLKYFHPGVAQMPSGGSVDNTAWDAVLVQTIPKFRAATTVRAFNQEVLDLVGSAGASYLFRGTLPDIPATGAAIGPAFAWIDDARFEPGTRTLLRAIVVARHSGPNAYVSKTSNGSPDFSKDVAYANVGTSPNEEVRLLGLFRFWNMVRYYCPGNDIMDRDWNHVPEEFVPLFRQAGGSEAYHLAVARLTASINDTHASTYSVVLAAYFGGRYLPVRLRLVEGQTVVTQVYDALLPGPGVLRAGDVITHIGGVETSVRRAELAPIVNGSNAAALERNIHDLLVRTNAAEATLTVRQGSGAPTTLTLPTISSDEYTAAKQEWVTRNCPLWTILPGNIGYVHMGLLTRGDVDYVMGQLRHTRGLVIDVRNYPQGTLYDVSNYLNPTAVPFVMFTFPNFEKPGRIVWSGGALLTGPGTPNGWNTLSPPAFTYAGHVAVLADQETQSQAEYTVMALQTAPNAMVIGSQTAGADGNVSLIRLPGQISTYFSGLGVFYPDGRPTQRIGIVPDREVRPTIAGLRAGLDEVLDAAIQVLK